MQIIKVITASWQINQLAPFIDEEYIHFSDKHYKYKMNPIKAFSSLQM